MPDSVPHPAAETPVETCLRVGITGGIGSGKTTVCRMFEALGIPVYYADERAKWLISNDETLKNGIVDLLGPEAYTAEGAYDRAYVARIVFSDAEKLKSLNALVHPAVEADSRRWHEAQCRAGLSYTLKEAALMIESGSHRHLDRLIVVTAPEALRIRRVMERDSVAEEQVRSRMAHQLPEADKIALADFVIRNDGELPLIPQVWQIHQSLSGK